MLAIKRVSLKCALLSMLAFTFLLTFLGVLDFWCVFAAFVAGWLVQTVSK